MVVKLFIMTEIIISMQEIEAQMPFRKPTWEMLPSDHECNKLCPRAYSGALISFSMCRTCPVLTNVWWTKLRRGLAAALIPPWSLLVSGFLGRLSFQVGFSFFHLILYHLWSSRCEGFPPQCGQSQNNWLLPERSYDPNNYYPVCLNTALKALLISRHLPLQRFRLCFKTEL